MNAPAQIKHRTRALARRYHFALRRFLVRGPAVSLGVAAKLGRDAAALGLETLDLASIHEHALADHVLSVGSSAAHDRIIKRAGLFFATVILPLEKTHRTALKVNARLRQLNQGLSQRTLELATSNRQLKREISKRKATEHALCRSEARSGQLLLRSHRLQERLRCLSRRVLLSQEDERKRGSVANCTMSSRRR